MRNSYFLLMAVLVFVACKKDVEEEAYLSYTLSGKETKYTGSYQSYEATGSGVFITKSTSNSPGIKAYYILEGIGGSNDNRISISLRADSLKVGDYSSGDTTRIAAGIQMKTGVPSVGYVFSQIYHVRKPLLVQISKHSSGRISGTFSGRVYRVSGLNPTDSAEIAGTFSSLEVKY